MSDVDTRAFDRALGDAITNIEQKRAEYELTSKQKKFDYLNAVAEAKEEFGTTQTAKGLGVTRHRIYQILNEAQELGAELQDLEATA